MLSHPFGTESSAAAPVNQRCRLLFESGFNLQNTEATLALLLREFPSYQINGANAMATAFSIPRRVFNKWFSEGE